MRFPLKTGMRFLLVVLLVAVAAFSAAAAMEVSASIGKLKATTRLGQLSQELSKKSNVQAMGRKYYSARITEIVNLSQQQTIRTFNFMHKRDGIMQTEYTLTSPIYPGGSLYPSSNVGGAVRRPRVRSVEFRGL